MDILLKNGKMPISSYYQKNKKKWLALAKVYTSTPKGRYTSLKKGAKARGKNCSLTFENCLSLWNEPCFYCGCLDFTKMGIDRVDSSVGYVLDNCVACCTICNYMKHDLHVEDFLTRCVMIVENRCVTLDNQS